MTHVEIDPKQVIAQVKAQGVLQAQAQALHSTHNLGNVNRGQHVILLLRDGTMVQGEVVLNTFSIGRLMLASYSAVESKLAVRRGGDSWTSNYVIDHHNIEDVEITR